jgi:hypothetical protein
MVRPRDLIAWLRSQVDARVVRSRVWRRLRIESEQRQAAYYDRGLERISGPVSRELERLTRKRGAA